MKLNFRNIWYTPEGKLPRLRIFDPTGHVRNVCFPCGCLVDEEKDEVGPSHYMDLFRSNPYFSADGNGDVEKFFELYIKNLDLTNGKGYI